EVKTLEHEAALAETLKLLEQEKVVIFEAAIKYQNYFIRIDILEKNGQHFSLHEVKAKSWHPENDSLLNKSGHVASEWEPYVADLAFQTYVLKAAFPNSKVKSYLMLANSEATATVDGL